jgi:hypothetical protein
MSRGFAFETLCIFGGFSARQSAALLRFRAERYREIHYSSTGYSGKGGPAPRNVIFGYLKVV